MLDRRKGVDDGAIASGAMPGKGEPEEFFLLTRRYSFGRNGTDHRVLKSAPSLLTLLDAQYTYSGP